MAATYPKSKFYGVDLYDSKITDDIPENCSFPECKLDKRLPFDDAVFDYVFVGCAVLVIKNEDLPKLLVELKRVLKPGGYLEWLVSVSSVDEYYPENPKTLKTPILCF